MAVTPESRAVRHARQTPSPSRLRIDPSSCDGVGICAHLAPDLITVDSWGYPILDPEALATKSEQRQAAAAVAACPRSALYLDS